MADPAVPCPAVPNVKPSPKLGTPPRHVRVCAGQRSANVKQGRLKCEAIARGAQTPCLTSAN